MAGRSSDEKRGIPGIPSKSLMQARLDVDPPPIH
jgi:hypothetical protein